MRVLQVPFHFGLDQLGGTEIYVASLCKTLAALGVESAIAAPAQSNAVARFDETTVYYFGLDRQAGFEQAHGQPDTVAATNFRDVLAIWRPDVVHLHARSSAVSELLVVEAKLAGCKVVYTYHTPTASCARGTMMYGGSVPCDGKLDVTRCTDCVLQHHGVSAIPRSLLARTPAWLGKLTAGCGRQGGLWTALRMRSLQTDGQRRFHEFVDKVDKVVAVCDWVAQVLRRNGLSEPKLQVSRQGLPYSPLPADNVSVAAADCGRMSNKRAPLRICYFGRIDPTKGVDVLVAALQTIPQVNVSVDIYGIRQSEESAYIKKLEALIALDPRITLKAPLAANQVVAAMRKYDLVAVPSQWLETGPLVVLEAFAAGTPVIGSRLGGIAELLMDGVDGVLVDAADVGAWAAKLNELAANHQFVASLNQGIKAPRLMHAVANEMYAIYLQDN